MLTQTTLNKWLFVLLCLLAMSIYFFKYQSQATRLTQANIAEITRIKIETDDKAAIILHKKVNNWDLIDISNTHPTDNDKVQQILLLLHAPSLRQLPAIQTELHKYALLEPRVNVYFNDLKISFGDLEPIKSLRYVLIDDTVHLIKDEFYRHLLTHQKAFLSR